MCKLSFIVPVYNVEKYLRKCVDSLLAQDYSDYEIILVDDGSTDDSGAICDEYAQKSQELRVKCQEYPLIRAIHRKNGGLSAARNAGIAAAKGEYICFVDSDDYWQPDVLGALMLQVESQQLDVLRFNYQNVRLMNEGISELVSEGEYEVFEPNKNPHQVDICSEVVDGETYLNTRMGGYECYAVMFVIRRELLDGCLFTEGIYFEDTDWTPRMFVRAKRVASISKVVYNYLTRDGSITQKFDIEHINKKIKSLMQVNISLQHLLLKVNDDRWINGCIADNVYCIFNNVATYDYDSVQYWVEEVRKYKMLPLRGYKVRKITMLRYRIINISPKLYCWLRHIRMHYLRK